MPITFSGLELALAISVIGKADVLEAKMQSGRIYCSTLKMD
jgi:hypothetical protein